MTITTDRTTVPTLVLALMETPGVVWTGKLIHAVCASLESMTPETTDIDEMTLQRMKNLSLNSIPAIAGWAISKAIDAAAERFGF